MSAPWWQRLVVTTQQEVGGRARQALEREDVMGALTGLRSAAGGVRSLAARPVGGLAHLAQLPTTTDVRALHRQLASLEREVRELRKQVGDTSEATVEPYR